MEAYGVYTYECGCGFRTMRTALGRDNDRTARSEHDAWVKHHALR